MRNEELFKQFVEFCESQPEDKKINHFVTFRECAIGDFATYLGKDAMGYNSDSFAREVLGYDTELYHKVNRAFNYPPLIHYGNYTKMLKRYI